MKRAFFLSIIVSGILIVGCSSGDDLALTETYIFPDFGFSIDYPEGWFVDTADTITWIRQDETDFELRFRENRKLEGIGINFDHRTLEWLNLAYGLDDYPTLNDLFQLNIEAISHMVNPEVVEATIFGVEALQSEFYGDLEQYYATYAGYTRDEAFLFGFVAPNEQEFEDFKPTWELIIESITPVIE